MTPDATLPSRALVDALCSDACAGRRSGTPGGVLARGHVIDALRGAGLDPFAHDAPKCQGANVIATIPGDLDRWVLVAAHYDHLGANNRGIFRGADDNAAAVAALVALGASLARRRPDGRGVILAAFDGEEPPFFATERMGSQQWVQNPTVPLDRIDMMVAMELLGHRVGPEGLPAEVRDSLFVLGTERSEGTAAMVEHESTAVPGVVARRLDAEVIPPLSDHLAFWEAQVPFVLLTGTRSASYHTVHDTPDRLDWDRIDGASQWLERFVRGQCARPEDRVRFRDTRDDASTLDAMRAMLSPLAGVSPLVAPALAQIASLRARCDGDGRLPDALQPEVPRLVAGIESALS